MAKVHVMDHPLIAHKISYIRSEEVGTKEFREMIGEIAQLMCYEATREKYGGAEFVVTLPMYRLKTKYQSM